MNVRIFWVREMKCMCAQTRPRFILSSARVFWGMEFETMLTPREKSPPPENFPRGGSNPQRCGQRAQTLPTSYSGLRTNRIIVSKLEDFLCMTRSSSSLDLVCNCRLLWQTKPTQCYSYNGCLLLCSQTRNLEPNNWPDFWVCDCLVTVQVVTF